jgi:outer membrane receptor protein involved in Fe transport
LAGSSLYAGDTGKITGYVKDKKTGEGIAGANVLVEGTNWGAMTDLDGYFTILRIKPGKYSVKTTYIGYIPMIQKDVVVSIDINTQVNFNLEATVLEAAAPVEITYEKPAVIPGVTSSEHRITKEQFEVLPVNDLGDMLTVQAGVKVDAEGKYHFRGGRDDEVLFVVQGLEVNDQLGSGRRTYNLPTEAINEVQVMTGSFDAEYSGALSGVVNQSLETGSTNFYSGRFTWQTDRLWKEYSFDTDRIDANFGGPIPMFKIRGEPVTFSFTAWGNISNTYTPFNVTRSNSDVLGMGLELPERQDNVYGYSFNSNFPISPTKKMTLMLGGNRSQWDVYPWGDAVGGNYGYQYFYNVLNRPYVIKSEQLFNLTFTNQISSSSYYDVSFGRFYTNTNIRPRNTNPGDITQLEDVEDIIGGSYLNSGNYTWPNIQDTDGDSYPDGYADADGDNVYEGEGEGYEDLNFNGQWDRGEDWIDLNGNNVFDGGMRDPISGQWLGEPILDDKDGDSQWDPDEHFVDLNENGIWDPPEFQLPEQDWNGNGIWDGERFVDANGNGQYDGWGEGYDDANKNGVCDKKMLYNNETEDTAEPYLDGDLWFDTGEPFTDKPRLVDGEWLYNGVWDADEDYVDLPSSYTSLFGLLGFPTLNGQYDPPNGAFDEYELFTRFANLEYGMDPSQPVLYNFNPDAHGSDWMWTPAVNSPGPGYLEMNAYTAGKTTWSDRNGNGVFNPPNYRYDQSEYFEDYNGNGVWNRVDYFLNPGLWDDAVVYQDRFQTEYTLKFNYQNQVSKHHTLTSGGQFKFSIMEMQSIQGADQPYTGEVPLPAGSPYPGVGAARDFYKYSPYEGGLFFRDVMEFEGLIIKTSLRWDFFLHDPDYVDVSRQLAQDYPYFTYQNRRGRYTFAPRLGISHPITRGSKLFFNYSHKYQRPRYNYFFAAATSNLANAGTVGNPDLEYEKTVEYELGVETEVGREWLFKVAGYYKDTYNTMGTVPVIYGPLNFDVWSNTDYGRGKGVEFGIDKRFSFNYLISFKYDFSFAEGKASSDVEAQQQRLQNVPVNHDEYPLGWDERHRINFYATIRYNYKEYPRLFGMRLPDNWLMTLQWEYGSGTPYTPSTYTTGTSSNLILPNSARYPWTEKTSLKIEKYFQLRPQGRTQFILGVEVENLFNKRNINTLYSETGSPYYAVSPLNPTYDPTGSRDDYDTNPRNFDPGRNVLFRFGVQF